MFVQSLRLPALTQSCKLRFLFEADWFIFFFLPSSCNETNQIWLLREFQTLYSKPFQEAAVWLHYSKETNATFYSQWGHIGGCWSTWASSASPLLKGGSLRGQKRSEIEHRRLMSHKMFVANNTIPAQMLQLPAEVHCDWWTYYCCHPHTHRHELEPCSTPMPLAQQHTQVLQLNCLQRGLKGFLHPHVS